MQWWQIKVYVGIPEPKILKYWWVRVRSKDNLGVGVDYIGYTENKEIQDHRFNFRDLEFKVATAPI